MRSRTSRRPDCEDEEEEEEEPEEAEEEEEEELEEDGMATRPPRPRPRPAPRGPPVARPRVASGRGIVSSLRMPSSLHRRTC